MILFCQLDFAPAGNAVWVILPGVVKTQKKNRGRGKNLLTFAFCSPIFAPGRGNGKRVASA